MAVDWYDTKIKNAVNTASANQVVALCVDQETLNNPFCGSVGRAQGTGFVNFFFVGPQNVASFETSGLDATVNYRFTPGRDLGTFNMKFTGEYLQKLDFVPLIGAPVDHDAKEAGVPKYVATGDVTWTKGSFSLNYGLSFFSRTRRFTVEQLRANPDLSDPRYFFLKERWEHDVRASYDTDRFSFFGGINNFTDEKPAFAFDGLYPVSPIGRFFYVGAKVRLADIF